MERSYPRVAAVIATMDRPEFVQDAVASACEQTYGAIEIVIDGSDDNRTETVIKELQQTYLGTPITYVHNNTPQGIPAARNQGIAATNAGYLAFLDDDDRWYPEKTNRQMSVFRSTCF